MDKQRKQYETAFKLEVARTVVDHGLSIAQVVNDTGIGRTAVCRWVDQYRAEQQGKPGIGKPLTVELQRIRRLRSRQNYCRASGVREGATTLARTTPQGGHPSSVIASRCLAKYGCSFLSVL